MVRKGISMPLSNELSTLLEQAIDAYAYRDFARANDIFETITRRHPANWTARYFHAMTLCATGDFSDAREQLLEIARQSSEPVWQQVARNGMELVNSREQSIRQSLNQLLYNS
jgi:hypothetical protein